jgi:ADP-ribose pyrophosphatase YjhB (NUDIX family)
VAGDRAQAGPGSGPTAGQGDPAATRKNPAASAAPKVPYEPGTGELFAHEALAVVLQVREERLCVLLWQRAEDPFRGRWALPGGPLGGGERLGTSASRHLATKVDLTDIAYLEQLETRSDPQRDPRGRVLATAYLALVTAGLEPRVPEDTAWHPVAELPPTAFDHGSITESGRGRLRAKLSYTNIGFALAPETFTILQRVLTRRGVIDATDAAARPTQAGGRPATLYRFTARTLVVTHPFAAFRPPGSG